MPYMPTRPPRTFSGHWRWIVALVEVAAKVRLKPRIKNAGMDAAAASVVARTIKAAMADHGAHAMNRADARGPSADDSSTAELSDPAPAHAKNTPVKRAASWNA